MTLDPAALASLIPGGYGLPVRDPSDQDPAIIPGIGVAPPTESPGYPVMNPNIDADQLQMDLAQALGRDVAIVARPVANGLDGVLWIKNPKTGLDLAVDPAVVAQVIADHEPPETEDARFLREYDAAADVVGKLDAYRDHIARVSSEDQRNAVLRETGRQRLAALAPKLSARARDLPDRAPVPAPVVSRNPWTKRLQAAQQTRQ